MSKTKDAKKDVVLAWIKHDLLSVYLGTGMIWGVLFGCLIIFVAIFALDFENVFLTKIEDDVALSEYIEDAIYETSRARVFPDELWDTGVMVDVVETQYVPTGPTAVKKSNNEKARMYFAVLQDNMIIVLQKQQDYEKYGSLEELDYIRVDNKCLDGAEEFIASVKFQVPALCRFDNVYVLNGYYQRDIFYIAIMVSIPVITLILILILGIIVPRMAFFQKKTKTGKNIMILALREYVSWKDICRQINDCVNNQVLYQSGKQYITKSALFLYPNGRVDMGINPILIKDIATAEVLKSEEPFEYNTLRFYLNSGKIYDFTIYENDYEANQIVRYILSEKNKSSII